MAMPAPLILTLKMGEHEATYFNHLRRAHFPKERNFIDAHLTIFHHLPAVERSALELRLTVATRERAPLSYRITGLRMLGRGVAFAVASSELVALRAGLTSDYWGWLTPQDRATFAPHITVQNKVDPAAARTLLSQLNAGFEPFDAVSPGLDLWSYLGGPWRHEAFFPFLTPTAGA